MPETSSHRTAGVLPQSAHALQLQRGFPYLKFDAPLEEEFAAAHRAEMLPQVRRNLWLAIAFVVGFSALTHMVLEPEVNRLLDWIRLAVFGPLLTIAIAVVHSRLYERLYPLVCRLGPGLRFGRPSGTSFARGEPALAITISSPAAARSTSSESDVFASYRL